MLSDAMAREFGHRTKICFIENAFRQFGDVPKWHTGCAQLNDFIPTQFSGFVEAFQFIVNVSDEVGFGAIAVNTVGVNLSRVGWLEDKK